MSKTKKLPRFIVESGLDDFSDKMNSKFHTEMLEAYLVEANPHPEYWLVSVVSKNRDWVLVWELKD